MITASMLKRQVWMADDDAFAFDHIVTNSQMVLKLNAQYENHPYSEEFTKELSVIFVYGTSGRFFTKQRKRFLRQMIKCMKAWNYLQKPSDLLLNTEIIKEAHKIMTDGEKEVLVGGGGDIESHLYL